jgi:hypothetical protein
MLLYVVVFISLAALFFKLALTAPKTFPFSLISSAAWWHLALAVLCVFSLIVFGGEYVFSDCGLVPNSSTSVGGVTSFTWIDTCSAMPKPAVLGAATTVFAWTLIFEGIILLGVLPLWMLGSWISGRTP